jgi:hypothetical protein
MDLIAGKGCGFLLLSCLFLSLAIDHLSHQVLSLSSFSLLLFIFLTRFSLSPLSLSCSSSSSLGSLSLSLSSFSLRPSRSSSSNWSWRYSLSHLSLYGHGGPFSLLFHLVGVFNLYNIDFSIGIVLVIFFILYNHCC